MKKEFDFAHLPILPDKAKTTAIFNEISENINLKINPDWEKYCNNIDDEEKAFFEYLGVDLKCCVPIINNGVEFMCSVCGTIANDAETAEFCVGKLDICAEKSPDYAQSGMLDLVVAQQIKPEKKMGGIFQKIVYLKAKKQTEYKIAMQWQQKLYAVLKSKGVNFIPLSSDECKTYQQIWFEIFYQKKLGKKDSILSFFENENFEFETSRKADLLFDKANKRNANVILPQFSVGVKTVNTSKLKSDSMYDFMDIVITAFDFSWTYCKKSDGKTYFYKSKGKKS